MALAADTYAPSAEYSLSEGFEGFVNATAMNNGSPLFYCQPHFLFVRSSWYQHFAGTFGAGGVGRPRGRSRRVAEAHGVHRPLRMARARVRPGIKAPTVLDTSFLWIEPITGLGTAAARRSAERVRAGRRR